MDALTERTTRVLAATDRAAESARLWDSRVNAMEEVESMLKDMAPGGGRCMYCEAGEGTDIEHFWPKSRFPEKTFHWENHLWACSCCNSNHKRTQFPLDQFGRPILLNPTCDDPREHLCLAPKTGKYVGLTHRGRESITVYGLYRDLLEKARARAFASLQVHITRYGQLQARQDEVKASVVRELILSEPHASVLVDLLRVADSANPELVDAECLQVLSTHSEIRAWCKEW